MKKLVYDAALLRFSPVPKKGIHNFYSKGPKIGLNLCAALCQWMTPDMYKNLFNLMVMRSTIIAGDINSAIGTRISPYRLGAISSTCLRNKGKF